MTVSGEMVLQSVALPDTQDRGIRILRADPCILIAPELLQDAPGLVVSEITPDGGTFRCDNMDGGHVTYRLIEYDVLRRAWSALLIEDTRPTPADLPSS